MLFFHFRFRMSKPVESLKIMAHEANNDGCWSRRPKILFIKCKKGLSKEKIQDTVIHSLREVSENFDKELPCRDYRVDNLSSANTMQDVDITQVSIGPSYIGVLLKNGQVCRFRCETKGPNKVTLSSGNDDKVPFLTRSDSSFARQLQDTLNVRRRRGRRNQRSRMSLEGMDYGVRHRDFRGFPVVFSDMNETRGDAFECGTTVPRSISGNVNTSESNILNLTNRTNGSAQVHSSGTASDFTGDQNSSPPSIQRSAVDNANERIQRESVTNIGPVSAGTNTHQTARRTLALAQILQRQSEMLQNFVSSQQQASLSRTFPRPFSRVQYHSSPPNYFPTLCRLSPHYLSATLENRRISPVFSRRGRSFPAPSFVRQVTVENPTFIQVDGDRSSKKHSSDKKDKENENEKSKNFNWPVIGEVEWLQTESMEEIAFTDIAAMTTAFLLVTDSGQLFEWPYEDTCAEESAANHTTNHSSGYFKAVPLQNAPKAVPHPLMHKLGLEDKRVCLVATCGIRATVLTTSGHLCTFYDKLVTECKSEHPPSLVQELSHPAVLFPKLAGESIVSLDCHEFYSAVMSSSGHCYWWGLLPGGERRDLEEKISTLKREIHLSIGDKVRQRKIWKGSPGTLAYKNHDFLGPCVGQILDEKDTRTESASKVRVEIVAMGLDISKYYVRGNKNMEPGRSNESDLASSSSSSRVFSPVIDTWELSDIVLLENEPASLGVVVGTDGPHVIVDTSHEILFPKPRLKVFKPSDLLKIPEKTDDRAGTSAQFKKEQSVYGRFLQETPKSVMETCQASCSYPAGSIGVAKCTLKSLDYEVISMACTAEGVELLVRNPSDDKVYYLGPSCGNLGDCSKRFTCSSEVSSTLGNGQAPVTVKAESVLGRDSALRRLDVLTSERGGLKRKQSSRDDEEDVWHSPTNSGSGPCFKAAFPRLIASNSSCGSILLDSNSCLFPRSLNTILNGFHSLEISPFQCFDVGQRLSAFDKEDYDVLVIPLVFKRQSLVKAIQTGLATEVQKVLQNLEDTVRLNSGKGGKVKGKKRVAVQNFTENCPVSVEKETWSFCDEIAPEISAVFSEKVSGNRNILHLCCSNLCIRPEVPSSTIGDVLNAYKPGNKTGKTDDHDISILKALLEHPIFGSEVMKKLKEKDVNGCTPFLLALRCQNFKAALFILDHLRERKTAGVFVDWKAMVYCRTSSGETPLHIVSMKSCSGLGVTGLGNSLIVSNLPSNYTPRMLLKLFQSRYPSAYRAAIPPLEDTEKAHSFTAWQKRERKIRGASAAKPEMSSEDPKESKSSLQVPATPSSSSSMRYGGRLRDGNGQRREALEGMVTFADNKEMRKALCEMDKHVVSNEMGHPDVGLTSVVQHILHVKLAKLNAESNKEDGAEMEMEYNGVLYGVTSKGLGCSPKINKKDISVEVLEETQKAEEDELVCKLAERLLENPEAALMTNGENETALAFLVNYCKWIKPTEHQKKRFQAYTQSKDSKNLCSNSDNTTETQNSAESTLSKPSGESSSSTLSSTVPVFPGLDQDSSEPWNTIMVEFSEFKNNFSDLVKSLESMNASAENDSSSGNTSSKADGQTDGQLISNTTAFPPSSESVRGNLAQSDTTSGGNAGPDGTVKTGTTSRPVASGSGLVSGWALDSDDPAVKVSPPILLQLAKSWPCVAKTVLGTTADDMTILATLDSNEETSSSHGKSDSDVSDACDLDFFVRELLSDADEVVLDTVSTTIVSELNKHSFSFRDYLDHSKGRRGRDAARLSLHVGQRFLRSVTRQLCFLLSHNNVAFVELPSSSSDGAAGRRRNITEIKRRARRVLSAFSWLSVYELVEAAEAVVSPFRDGVAKPQRSTGKDFGNVNNPVPILQNTFPTQYGGPRGRPGIRVSGDHGNAVGSNHLRTAPRLSAENELPQSHHFVGVRLLDVEEGCSSDSRSNGVSKRAQSRLFGRSSRQPSPLPTSSGYSDSDSDDGCEERISDETDMILDNEDRSSSPAVTGITHEHPFAWALDGRLTSPVENNNSGRGINFGIPSASVSPPSVHAGNCYLARVFSRLVKEMIDVFKVVDDQAKERDKESVVLTMDERGNVLEYCESILEKSWLWLINVMDTAEGQLQRGNYFDTKRYLVSLQQSGDAEMANLSRSSGNMAGATPEEYLMFLLRSHSNEHEDTLPVMDMLCYEHAVYVLDAFLYVLKGWPRSGKIENMDSRMDTSSSAGNDMGQSSIDKAPLHSNSMLNDESLGRFFFSGNPLMTVDVFVTELKRSLQQSSRIYVPSGSLEIFDRKNSVVDLEEKIKSRGRAFPVSYRGLSSRELKLPIMHQWSEDEVCDRWMISIDIFSRLFLAEGPGGERESFLAARAGTAGRIARFRRALSHLRDSVNSDQPQGMFGGFGYNGRTGTVLSLNVRRSHLLEDMLKFLGEISVFHYTNFRVKFDGEEGSGPGVNRGFFTAVANALKSDDKQLAGTVSLMYEPGKLPEQSGYFAPRPYCRGGLLSQEHEMLKRRHTMFKSIGRFLGLCLWFSHTIPLNLTRTVIKYILGREIVWQDLAFFNADLFDGLSRMIVDSMDQSISEETFQSTYCCHFEVSIGSETVELVANGSHMPVTKNRTFEYARLYGQKVMLDCVEEELSAMKQGIHEVIPPELLDPLTTEDFQLLISGGTLDIDINRLKSITSFVNSNGCSADIMDRFKKWFWSIVNKMTPIQRQQLLYFATGSAMLPAVPDRKENDQDVTDFSKGSCFRVCSMIIIERERRFRSNINIARKSKEHIVLRALKSAYKQW